MKNAKITLIMDKKSFFIPARFDSLSDVAQDIYLILTSIGKYHVKSKVNEEIFKSFINHWINNETPNIQVSNLFQYFQLSQEFDRMKDLMQMFRVITRKRFLTSKMQENETFKQKKESKGNYLHEITISYHQIIHHLFTNTGIDSYSKFLENKEELLQSCNKRDVRFVNALTQKQIEIKNFLYSINEKEGTAGLLKHQFLFQIINLPSTIIFDSKVFSITSVYKDCFSHQKLIKTINFSEDSKLKIIDKKSFFDSSIEFISIPATVTEIGDYAFAYCSKLKKIEFSEKSELKTIGMYSFYGSSIEVISIPKQVFYIGDYSFYNCSHLKKIEFSENSELQKICQKTFYNSSLENILIPSRVKRVCSNAFSNCKKLKKVEFSENSELEMIEDLSFNNSSIESLYITSIKNIEFEQGWCARTAELNDIIINPKNEFFAIHENTCLLKKSDILNENYDVLMFAKRKIESVTIPSFVTQISSYSFDQCKLLKKVEFSEPSELKIIQKFAFAQTSLENIVIPSNVTLIDYYSFFDCKKLSKIEFSNPSKLKSIGSFAFQGLQIESILIPPQVEIINDFAFSECRKLNKIEFIERSESNSILIRNFAFFDSEIQCLSLPLGNIELEDAWCRGTPKLTNIILNSKSKDYLFFENKYLLKKSNKMNELFDFLLFSRRDIKYAIIPPFITNISAYAFEQCKNMINVEFPVNHSKISSIGEYAFAYTSIKKIIIPSTIVSIGKSAFRCCRQLKSIIFDKNSNLNSIEEYGFSETSLVSFSVPPHLKKIDSSIFFRCLNLKIIEIPENTELESLNPKAFSASSSDILMIPEKIKEKMHLGI